MSFSGESLIFQFHKRVQVVVEADHPQDRGFFADEYRHHRVERYETNLPTLCLRLRRGSVLSTKPPTGFTQYRHKLLANWSYKIEFVEGGIMIEATASQMAVPMIHHMLVHPGLRWLCSSQGVLLLHAGGVATNGASLILTGKGGSGKTTTSSLLLQEGGQDWQPHADDYVFLVHPGDEYSPSQTTQSLAYMTRSHLYRDLLRWVPEIRQRLTPAERLRLQVFGLVRKWSRERIKWPVRIPVEQLWPNRRVADHAQLAACLLLNRSPIETEPYLQRINVEQSVVDDLLEMNFSEAHYFLKLINLSAAIPNFPAWLNDWKSRETNLLKVCLQGTRVFQLSLSAKMDFEPQGRHKLFELVADILPGPFPGSQSNEF